MGDVEIKYTHLQFLLGVFDGKLGLQSERLKMQFVSVDLEVCHIGNASLFYHLQVIIVQWLCHRRFIKVLSFVEFCVSWEKGSEQFKAQILKCIHEE
jgi:hypothetical protein